MKKIYLVFLISVLLVACNNDTAINKDAADSSTVAPSEADAAADTATVADSIASRIKSTPDSINPTAIQFDNPKKKTDSLAK